MTNTVFKPGDKVKFTLECINATIAFCKEHNMIVLYGKERTEKEIANMQKTYVVDRTSTDGPGTTIIIFLVGRKGGTTPTNLELV